MNEFFKKNCKYFILGGCIIACLFFLWAMFSDNNIRDGVKRTEQQLDTVREQQQRAIESTARTERILDNSQSKLNGVEESINSATRTTDRISETNQRTQELIDRSAEINKRSQELARDSEQRISRSKQIIEKARESAKEH